MVSYQDPQEEKRGTPAWMATFSDLMTQILVFFVFLFTLSSVEKDKFREAVIAFRGSFGVIKTTENLSILVPKEHKAPPHHNKLGRSEQQAQADDLMEELLHYADKEGFVDHVYVDRTETGIVLTLTNEILFQSGTAVLKKRSYKALANIAAIIKKFDFEIKIEGHTDNRPILKGPYASNWELSAARALSINKYFIEEQKISPEKLSIAGYGEYRPVVENDSVFNRAKNRRVEIIFIEK